MSQPGGSGVMLDLIVTGFSLGVALGVLIVIFAQR